MGEMQGGYGNQKKGVVSGIDERLFDFSPKFGFCVFCRSPLSNRSMYSREASSMIGDLDERRGPCVISQPTKQRSNKIIVVSAIVYFGKRQKQT